MGYSNLAYKYDEQENIQEEKVYQSASKKQEKRNFRPIIYVLVLCFAAYYMISKNVAVYETEQEIKALQKEITQLESYTSQRIYELEQSVDLSTVERIATTKLNMQRPDQYQIEYVNVEREDVTEVTSNEVEGVGNKVKNATKSLKRNMAGIFSLGAK